jgi:uncharacterized membrane protein (UPF0127 family)
MTPLLLSLLLAAQSGVPDGGIVLVNGHKFLAEVARTPQEQARGLMYRQFLAKDRCMIFLYDEDGNHRIWMKNCLIALDVVWILEDGTVVETHANTLPCSPMLGDNCPVYGGTVPARHFVEFPAGTLGRIGLKIGDRLGWKLNLDGREVTGGAQAAGGRKRRKTVA